MSNPPPQPPSNGGEFLLSLLQKSQRPSQPQPPQHLAQHPLTTDPAIAAVGPALLFPSPSPPPPQVQHQPQLWHDLTPSPPSGGYFTSSVLVPGNQFPGVNYGFEVVGDGAVGQQHRYQQQGEQRLMFGSIPSGIGRYEGLVNGNLLSRSGKEWESGSRIGFNGSSGSDGNRQFGDRGRLNFGSSVSGYQGLEQERMGNGSEYQSRSPDMRGPPPGFRWRLVDAGNLDLGDKRGFMQDNETGRGNGLIYKKGLGKEQSEGMRRMCSDDGKKVGDQGLSGQLDRPGPPAGSNLRSVLSSDMEDALMKLHTEVGGHGDRKGDRRGEVDEDIDDLGEEMVDSLLLEDESDSKNDKKQHRKEFRSDPRGQHMLSQRVRNSKGQVQCRSDLERLNAPFIELYKSLVPAEEQKAKQKQLLMSLEKVVLSEWPHARLYVYGSCANSFGVSKSDIDVCLAFGDVDINKSEVLLKLAEMLESNNLQNVQPLTRARVPIVKLMDPVTGLSCDICINNVLAVVNTKLLRDYAQIDVRLHQLAFIVKHWAKCRGVNETYQGTLSSYAYVLMCIHFLQRRKPAILPCLQGMNTTYSVTVDGIECAYFDQVEKLRSFGSRNKESIAQLVWGFFNYWAFCHDYAKSVISIRRGSIISKHEKDWTKRVGNDRHLICIEDPLETSHDLGRVVDRKSIRVLREEFERAADIMQYDPHPYATLFEPYIPE